MQIINRFGGDKGKIQSPNFRKHLRRRRSLDTLNAMCSSDHDINTVVGCSASSYVPVHQTQTKKIVIT